MLTISISSKALKRMRQFSNAQAISIFMARKLFYIGDIGKSRQPPRRIKNAFPDRFFANFFICLTALGRHMTRMTHLNYNLI